MDLHKIHSIRENFKARNMNVEYVDTLQEACSYILNVIPIECTIGIGHSVTLQNMNITSVLYERGNIVYDKELANNREECIALKKKALISDWYITGSNAITADGRIVNVDHSGNRVAAISFGPDKVVIVVGKNKIVDTLDDALKRVKNIACPANAKRAGYNPPCVTTNQCVDCLSKERVCNILSIIEGQIESDRITLLIVNEEHGF